MKLLNLVGLMPMPYHYGTMKNGKWQKEGTIIITNKGVLYNEEKLVNPNYQAVSRSLVFGGNHGSYARTGRLTFDPTLLYFHGVMEGDDGDSNHVIGFADFSATYASQITPTDDPGAPSKIGPTLKISIDSAAFDNSYDTNPINFTLVENGTPTNITKRVTSHKLNSANHTFKISMGPGPAFPPTSNLFDVVMQTDMSSFAGTFDFGPQKSEKYSWVGTADGVSLATVRSKIQYAESKLETATVPEIRNTAATAILSRVSSISAKAALDSTSDDESNVLPGLDAQDLAFIAEMDAKGMKIATLDNIRATSIVIDDDGKPTIKDEAQKLTATMMNTATLKSLKDPWATDFKLRPEKLDDVAEGYRQDNIEYFTNNSNLQMANLLKYRQDKFTGVDLAAIKTIDKEKLKKAYSFKTMTPERLEGYTEASTKMYGHAYTVLAQEFSAYTELEKEKWGRAYFHWLTDPSQINSWQKQLNVIEPEQVTAWIYEWHAKLSILAPNKPYAAAMQAYALASFINAKSQTAKWTDIGIPFMAEAIITGGKANTDMTSAAGELVSSKKAPFIKQKLADLTKSVGAKTVANAISEAALLWQKTNTNSPYYGYLFTNADAIDDIVAQMDIVAATAFKAWAASAPSGSDSETKSSAGEILAYCVFTAINGVLLAGLAPKSKDDKSALYLSESGLHLPPDVAWVLKGIKIGQIVVNGGASTFSIFFTKAISRLWTQYIGEAGEASPEFAVALKVISKAIEDGEEIGGWALSFGKGLSTVLKFAGPILALVGVGLSAFNLAKDIMNGRAGDAVFDSIGLIIGAIGAGIGIAAGLGFITAATAGPIGLVLAVVGLIILGFKMLWDWLFPEPTPIQSYVAGPLTDLNLIGPS